MLFFQKSNCNPTNFTLNLILRRCNSAGRLHLSVLLEQSCSSVALNGGKEGSKGKEREEKLTERESEGEKREKERKGITISQKNHKKFFSYFSLSLLLWRNR